MLEIKPTFTADVVCTAIYNNVLNAQIPVAAITSNRFHDALTTFKSVHMNDQLKGRMISDAINQRTKVKLKGGINGIISLATTL